MMSHVYTHHTHMHQMSLSLQEQQQPSSFPDDYIPRTPKAVVSTEVPQVKEDPSVVPTTPGTPISRIRTPQKPTPQDGVPKKVEMEIFGDFGWVFQTVARLGLNRSIETDMH